MKAIRVLYLPRSPAILSWLSSWVFLGHLTGATLFVQCAGPGAFALEETGKWKLTIYKVWASDETRDAASKELEKFADQLKKSSKKKAFRLEGKPVTQTLDASGKPVTLKLPGDYEARWVLDKDKEGKPAVRQTLVNPRKMEPVVDLLKKTITITHLEKIRKEKETFILMVELERPAKP